MNIEPGTALAKVQRPLATFAGSPELQRIWLNLEFQTWRSLALVPVGDSSSIDLVHALAEVAWQQRGSKVIVANLRDLSLPALASARNEIHRRMEAGERILIGVSPLDRNPTSSSVAREADKVVLCVPLNSASRSQLKQAIRELGTQNCLGTIVLNSRE